MVIYSVLASGSYCTLANGSVTKDLDFSEANHLIPEDSIYAEPRRKDYPLMVSELLPPAKNEVLRVLVFPSRSTEYAVSIQYINNAYIVEVRQAEMSYWGYKIIEMIETANREAITNGRPTVDEESLKFRKAKYPDTPEQIRINKCSKSLTKEISDKIKRIWERELTRVKHPELPYLGADGTTYHFSMKKKWYTLSGKTWSPSRHLPTGRIVAISDSLVNYCFEKGSLSEVMDNIVQAE